MKRPVLKSRPAAAKTATFAESTVHQVKFTSGMKGPEVNNLGGTGKKGFPHKDSVFQPNVGETWEVTATSHKHGGCFWLFLRPSCSLK
ncbi:MAG: hypothetical protein GC193_05320 [Cryomorphaceae bacterium]|nr:hypothetical protein [Cryomorphaceae bacterium]